MRGTATGITALVLACLMLLAGAPVNAQETTGATQNSDPESIYRAAYDAFNEGDMDAAMALFSDDVVGVIFPPPPGTDTVQVGKDRFQATMESAVADNMQWALDDFHVDGETASYSVSLKADDFFADLGLYPLEFTGFVVVRDGLIQSEVWNMTESTRAKIDRAMALEANKGIVQRFYDEIWNEGDMAVADEIIAVDFIDGFTGNDGVESLKDIVSILRAAYPDLHIEYSDIVAEGDIVVARITTTGTYAGGAPEFLGIPDSAIGKEVVIFSGVDYAQIEDGQMVRGWGTHDDLAALMALGYEVMPPAQ